MENVRFQEALQTLSVEHEVIQKQITGLRKFWYEVNELGRGPKFEEMTDRLAELRELLTQHFQEEERDGHLSAALRIAPQCHEQATALHDEHSLFVKNLDDLMSRFQIHEAAERAILRHAASLNARPTAA